MSAGRSRRWWGLGSVGGSGGNADSAALGARRSRRRWVRGVCGGGGGKALSPVEGAVCS